MNDTDILEVQRVLRKRLLEGPSAIRWRPGRELTAELLLYLDDPEACWRITTEWVRDTVDADRVDGGFGGFVSPDGLARDYVVLAEAQRMSMALPSVLGLKFNAMNPGLRAVWGDPRLAAIADVSQERSFTADLRGALRSVGTAAKLALPVRYGTQPLGLICADWHREAPSWDADVCNQLSGLARVALGPLLAAATHLAKERHAPSPAIADIQSLFLLDGDRTVGDLVAYDARPAADRSPLQGLADLTPAELRVARLIVLGMSYKEVARQLDRSLSTIDHQLRSIRDKLGARSTARVVHMLNEHLHQLAG